MQTALGQRISSTGSASRCQSNKRRGKSLCKFVGSPAQARRARPLSRSLQLRAADLEDTDVLSSVNFEHSEEGEYCMPGQVSVQNDETSYTMISMQVKDYPGLLRVVSWVFNGLELVVKRAKLRTDEDGIAFNSFWVTDRAGLALKKAAADLTAERMGDFLVYCTPSRKAMQATFFKEGPVTVDNDEHPEFTGVTIVVAVEVEGALLKVASALTNSGCSIQEGGVETKGGDGSEPESHSFGVHEGEREFKFLVTDRSGRKLDFQRATSLMYTIGLVFGKSEGSLHPPNSPSFGQ